MSDEIFRNFDRLSYPAPDDIADRLAPGATLTFAPDFLVNVPKPELPVLVVQKGPPGGRAPADGLVWLDGIWIANPQPQDIPMKAISLIRGRVSAWLDLDAGLIHIQRLPKIDKITVPKSVRYVSGTPKG